MVPALVADLTAAWNAHDAEQVLTCYAPEYEGTDVAERTPQRGCRRYARVWSDI